LQEQTIIEQRNRSVNTQDIAMNYPNGGEFFSSEIINVSWNASDLDGDNLSYAVLFSSDNGTTYNTVIFDHNETWFNLSSNDLEDSDQYLIKVLATDGVNTNSAISESFSIDNDLSINDFKVVYQNNTERIFRFDVNNTFDGQTLGNISWSLDTGESIISSNSSMNITLQPLEEAYVFVYHNYTVSGNYTVIATSFNEQFTERRFLNITV
jgi:hypothetical protein